MQVQLTPVQRNTGSFESTDALALAVIQGLNAASVPEPTARQQRQETEQRQAAQASAGKPSIADVQQQAERRLDPSSRSFRRGQVRTVARQQQMKRGQQAFRQALADAKGGGGRTTESTSPQTEPAREASAGKSSECTPDSAPDSNTDRPKSSPAQRTAPQTTQPSNRHSSAPTQNATAAQGPAAAKVALSVSPIVTAGAAASSGNATTEASAATAVRAIGEAKSASTTPTAVTDARTSLKTTRAAAQRPANPPQAQSADREANVERILRTIHSRIGQQRSTAIVRLDPPELGSLRLHLDLRDNVVSLRVDTQTEVARRLLNKELAALRRGLESAGLHLERVEIRPPNPAPDGTGGSPAQHADADGTGGGSSGETGAERSPQGSAGFDGPVGREAGADGGLLFAEGTAAELNGPATESRVNVLA